MDINNYAYDEGPALFYNDDFRAVIESHVDYLRAHSDTRVLNIEPHILYRYEFDMYSLLMHYNIPPYMHWIVLRINNLYSAQNFPKDLSYLFIPSDGTINILRQVYQSAH